MENFENNKQPKIKMEDLLSTVDNIKWKSGYKFSYNGTSFLLFIVKKEDIETGNAGEEAEFYRSTLDDGYDIYLFDTIPESKRKRVLFHEIIEANLQEQGFENNSHEIALREEQKIFNNKEE